MNFKFFNIMKSLGFSLIELMVVIAIVGILAAVAVPSYSRYIVTSKITEGMSIFPKYWNYCKEYYNSNGVMPTPSNLFSNFSLTSSATGSNYLRDNTVAWGNVTKFQYAKISDSSVQFSIWIDDERISGGDNGWLEYDCTENDDVFTCVCGSKSSYAIWDYLPGTCKGAT